MSESNNTLMGELRTIGIELKMLGDAVMAAVREKKEEILPAFILRRETLLDRIRQLANSHPAEILSCPELAVAAAQENEVLAVARPRRDELYEECQSVHRTIALRQTYAGSEQAQEE